MEDLRQEFPDLTQSFVRDVLRSVEGDENQAKIILNRFTNNDDPDEEEIQKKLKELENFLPLGRDVLVLVLKENKWDVEKAIVPLFSLLEEKQKEERRKIFERERLERVADAKKQANVFLKELFATVPENKIQTILDQNDGDVDATTDQLVEFLRKEDERQKKTKEDDRRNTERKQKRDALAIRFCKSEAEVDKILNSVNWDIPKAIQQLLKVEQDQKFQRIAKAYHFRSPEEIRHVLESNNYDENKTMKYLEDKIRQEFETQKLEEEAKKEADRKRLETLRREEELRLDAQRKLDAERKRIELLKEEELKKAAQLQWEAECRREAQRKAEENRKREEENKQREKIAREEQKKKEQQRKIEEEEKQKEDPRVAFMEKSVMINNEIERQVAIARQTEDPRAILKLALENRIRFAPSDVPGYVGNVPLTKVMVDRLKGKLDPVPNQDPPPPAGSILEERSDAIIKLVVTPPQVDFGDMITLEWEHSEMPSVCDWIGLYLDTAESKEYITYEWVTSKKGKITMKAPMIPGNYSFRYFVNKTYVSWGKSNPVKVGPTFQLTPTVVNPTEVKIKVDQLTGHPCPNAWLAMYEPDKDNKSYYTYFYLGSSSELRFKIPKVGVWEFRLFPQKTYYPAETCRVNLNGNDSLSLEVVNNQAIIKYNLMTVDPYCDNVWIGIFNQDETDSRQWRRYKYISESSGSVTAKVMQTPGTYEARLFACKSSKVRCKSNTVTIH